MLTIPRKALKTLFVILSTTNESRIFCLLLIKNYYLLGLPIDDEKIGRVFILPNIRMHFLLNRHTIAVEKHVNPFDILLLFGWNYLSFVCLVHPVTWKHYSKYKSEFNLFKQLNLIDKFTSINYYPFINFK